MKLATIQAVSGHKSEATIRTYSKYCPLKKKKQTFDNLQIDKSNVVPSKKSKVAKTPQATATIAKPPDSESDTSLENLDFLDFMPIQNNADDFDLGQIINSLDKENLQEPRSVENSSNPKAKVVAPKTAVKPANNTENAAVPVQNNPDFNQYITSSSTNNFPIEPCMIFQNSSDKYWTLSSYLLLFYSLILNLNTTSTANNITEVVCCNFSMSRGESVWAPSASVFCSLSGLLNLLSAALLGVFMC